MSQSVDIRDAYRCKVTGLVREEMVRRGVTYAQLAARLDMPKSSLEGVVARGAFPAAFFLHVMDALGVLRLEIP